MTNPIEKATSLIHCGQWSAAADILYGVLADTPEQPTALALMVVCKWQLQAFDIAECVASQLARSAPDNPTGLYLLAQIQLHQGALGAAEQSIRTCLHINPNSIDALKLCIIIQRRRHQWADARATRRYLMCVHGTTAGGENLFARARRWFGSLGHQHQPCLRVSVA